MSFHFPGKNDLKVFNSGLSSSLPIALGYFPVAIAFGLAAKGAGFSHIGALFISLFIFAGASQFALVGMVAGGTPLIFASFICLALNARHVIYGPALSSKIKKGQNSFIPFVSFGLTDEVFSASLSYIENKDVKEQMIWLLGIESGAYFSWCFGSWIGAFFGDLAINYLPVLESALSFALPALFLTLLVLMVNKKNFLPVLMSGLVTFLFIKINLGVYAIVAASLTGPFVMLVLRRVNEY